MCLGIACHFSQRSSLENINRDFDVFLGSNEQVKQKQRGAKRILLPSVVGQEGGKWIVIDSGIVFFSFSILMYRSLILPRV